jgi:glycosyltransferase involved in cell wall biosynthesis
VNDGSDQEHTAILEEELVRFMDQVRFCRLNYHKLDKNTGVGNALNIGVELCSYPWIVRMDADDMMLPTRIHTQFDYMMSHPEVVMLGAGIRMFQQHETGHVVSTKIHPKVVEQGTMEAKERWITNHPTLMMKKEAVLHVGNYKNIRYQEDRDLEERILQEYGKIHNLSEILVSYRLHPNQESAKEAMYTNIL